MAAAKGYLDQVQKIKHSTKKLQIIHDYTGDSTPPLEGKFNIFIGSIINLDDMPNKVYSDLTGIFSVTSYTSIQYFCRIPMFLLCTSTILTPFLPSQ